MADDLTDDERRLARMQAAQSTDDKIDALRADVARQLADMLADYERSLEELRTEVRETLAKLDDAKPRARTSNR